MTDDKFEGFSASWFSDVEERRPGSAGRPQAMCPTCCSLERLRRSGLTVVGYTAANARDPPDLDQLDIWPTEGLWFCSTGVDPITIDLEHPTTSMPP